MLLTRYSWGGQQAFEVGRASARGSECAREAFLCGRRPDATAKRHCARCGYDRQQSPAFQIYAPFVIGPNSAEQPDGRLVLHGILAHCPRKGGRCGRRIPCMLFHQIRQLPVPMNRGHVIEDIDIEDVLRFRAGNPFVDLCRPLPPSPSPTAFPRHDAALAERNTAFIKDCIQVRAEDAEPVIRAVEVSAVSVVDDQGVVLVGRQHALAAARGAKYQKAAWSRHRAKSVLMHARLGELRRAPREGAHFDADYFGYFAPVEPITKQPARGSRQVAQCGCEFAGIRGRLNAVAKRQRGKRSVAQDRLE